MSSVMEDCEIYLKPSTELVPDEYPQSNNENSCVHIFIYKEYNMEKEFVDCMKLLGYKILDENIHNLSKRKEVISSLEKICDDTKDKSSLIILFWGLFRADRKFLLKDGSSVKLIEIWSKFVSTNCPTLEEKPKIFIFNGFRAKNFDDFNGVKHLENTEEDTLPSTKRYSGTFSYNIPSEADILIVFKQNDDLRASIEYMSSLCNNFKNYAQREDISSLLTIAHFSSQPTLISTMTRKFYLKPCKNRGIQLTLREKYSKIENAIEKMKENIIDLTKNKKETTESFVVTNKTDSVVNVKKASSNEDLHRKVLLRQDVSLKVRPRSNTLSKLTDIDKILQRRKDLADQRPRWRY